MQWFRNRWRIFAGYHGHSIWKQTQIFEVNSLRVVCRCVPYVFIAIRRHCLFHCCTCTPHFVSHKLFLLLHYIHLGLWSLCTAQYIFIFFQYQFKSYTPAPLVHLGVITFIEACPGSEITIPRPWGEKNVLWMNLISPPVEVVHPVCTASDALTL